MVKMDILITSIILLYKERELDTSGVYDSRDLVRNTLSLSKPKRNLTLSGDMGSLEQDIYDLVNKMIESPENYEDKITLLAELNILCKDNLEYYNAVKNAIDVEMSEGGKKKSINSLRGKLYKHYQAVSAAQMVNRLSYNINNKMNSSVESEDKKKVSIQDMIMEVLPQLEALCGNINKKDPGLMDTLVMSSKDDIDVIANKIKAEKMEGGILKTGWKQLNTMLQQGFRRGEMGMICALQHNYKSGISQSLLMQFARYNKPVLKDPKKKPALIYISLEDEIMNVLKFMYRYLYYNENKELPDNTEHDISNLTTEQIQEYVMKRLGMNGYEVILLRADPGLWTYKDLFNTINKYEADGYEFHACIVDYLAKLPTTFCDNSGPAGTGMRDLFNRCRNFFSSKNILLLSPHQISTDGKVLIRNGVPEANFVKEIAGKGYTEMSKQLDQVVDLEIYIHKAKINKQWHLTFQRGKHRGQGIIDESKLYFTLKYPPLAPIPENYYDDDVDSGYNEDEDFTI